MGMNTHVVGFKPADEKWKKMKTAWDACERAGVEIPDEVLSFFNHVKPDERGVEVEIEKLDCVKAYRREGGGANGFEVDVKKLPPDVTIVRFYNSY